jgi:hypothetical protein
LRGFLIWLILFACSPEISSQNEIKILSTDKIIKLIPNKIIGFRLSADPQSKLMKLGTIQYSMAEKDFSASKKRLIKILLFDYKEAPVMYNQAIRKWSAFSTIETDSLIQRPTRMNNCDGWESYDAARKNSQILVGIFNRYYLTVEGTNVDLEFLRKVVSEFKLDTFPK